MGSAKARNGLVPVRQTAYRRFRNCISIIDLSLRKGNKDIDITLNDQIHGALQRNGKSEYTREKKIGDE